jgi:CYTH domain-containing protein
MATKKIPMTEEELGFRPLIKPDSKMKPLKQIFNGFEIEKRQLLCTKEEDHTKRKNALTIYNEVLETGTDIKQGYIKDIQEAIRVLTELGISLNEFKPNTIRFRKYGTKYILTLKDRKDTKKREVEFKLSRVQFYKYWPLTKGSRVTKKRLEKKIKGWDFEIDAFTDRFLLIIECEVDAVEKLDKVPVMGMDITSNSAWTNKSLSK